MATTAPPVGRIASLDVVRGVAVMGILLLNIIAFGLPEAAYINPRAFGGASGADLWAYVVNFIFFDGRMRGLFTLLFGASMLLVIERARASGRNPTRVHFARNLWLLVFGLAHLWLLWWGDILAHYALIACVAWFFRNLPVHRLLTLGVMLLVLQFLVTAAIPGAVWMLENGPVQGDAAQGLESIRSVFGAPDPALLAEQVARFRGDYAGIFAERMVTQGWSPIAGLFFIGPETLAYMLFGMAALQTGLLTGAWPRARYRRWMLIGFGVSLPGYAVLAWYLVTRDFSLLAVTGAMWLTVALRPPMIIAWACLILLAMRPEGRLTARIAAAGRMAFSNYLLTTIVCTSFFYGYGFGWFGYLSRAQLYLVVVVLWVLMLLWSKPWLDRFRYGPFEWLWRSLSRARLQPIRGSAHRADRSPSNPLD